MRISGVFILVIGAMVLAHPHRAMAVEEGQFVKKEGKWEYYSGEDLDRIYTLGLLYRLPCERRWAVRAIAELLNAARFVDWNPAHCR